VTRYGARHLLLISRRGLDAPGAADLVETLTGLGAEVRLVACDAGDRAALAALLVSVPVAHPLTAVVHCAGVVRDATIHNLTVERLAEVLRVKAEAAWHLHDLTRDADLAAFVLFSSVTGLVGGPGQGGYTAANAFLDALAVHRHARGAVATSVAWGMWDVASGMAEGLTDVDHARYARAGAIGLTAEQGLDLLDAALATGAPLLAAARLDLPSMRRQARTNAVPAVLRHLVRASAARSAATNAPALAKALAAMPEAERERALLDLVSAHTAAVLGFEPGRGVDPTQGLRELGFDSLTAVELRNRLATATGLRLPATFVFDHPNPAELARHLHAEFAPAQTNALAPMLDEMDRLERSLVAVGQDEQARLALTARLRAMLSELDRLGWSAEAADRAAERINNASVAEILDFIDRDLGRGLSAREA
jgi:hypothetical protein